ncbi:hypothetical protein N7471_003249 [Penicillium samsonianum]|uniref:uncharacterized protein n=1 Tax=Penicillium samsonianum TaxID=1882272 RepID=UPI0025471F89|nr:uncharacterized protein N7471_003249 [Penicillium samsonianum]KAJ6143796.1 hypothetical protein N7471_003249 [Penicillium samsonianum]
MKYAIATIAALASLFGQTIASNNVYEIESARSGDVWGIKNSVGVEHQVELVHPEGNEAEHWRLVSSGPDFFIQNVYTQGMLSCPEEHQCVVDTLGNNAQLFTVTKNPDYTVSFHPSGSPLVLSTGEGNELEAKHSDPHVDAAFRLRPI